ncbi:MAG: DUF6263 family protein [Bacteroidia bacterium]
MKHFLSRITILSLLCLAILTTAFTPTDQAINLELRLKKGQKFKQWVMNEQTIIQTIQGREQRINQEIGTGYAYEVLNVGPEKYDLKVTYYRMLFSQAVPGMEQLSSSYDSQKPHEDLKPLESAVAAQLNKSFEMSLDRKANILEIRGAEKLVEEMMVDLEKLNVSMATRQMQQGLTQTMNGETLKASMRQLIINLPAKAISVGDKWHEENNIKSVMVMNTYTDFEAMAINSSTATIKIEGELETDDNATMDMGGAQLDVGMGGTIAGEYIIDVKTGLLKSADYEMEAIGEMSLQGTTIPMIINTKTSITLEK